MPCIFFRPDRSQAGRQSRSADCTRRERRLALGGAGTADSVYRWVDADGVTHISSARPAGSIKAERIDVGHAASNPRHSASASGGGSSTAPRLTAEQLAQRESLLGHLRERECVYALESLDRIDIGKKASDPAERKRLQQTVDQNCSAEPRLAASSSRWQRNCALKRIRLPRCPQHPRGHARAREHPARAAEGATGIYRGALHVAGTLKTVRAAMTTRWQRPRQSAPPTLRRHRRVTRTAGSSSSIRPPATRAAARPGPPLPMQCVRRESCSRKCRPAPCRQGKASRRLRCATGVGACSWPEATARCTTSQRHFRSDHGRRGRDSRQPRRDSPRYRQRLGSRAADASHAR